MANLLVTLSDRITVYYLHRFIDYIHKLSQHHPTGKFKMKTKEANKKKAKLIKSKIRKNSEV